MRTHKLVESSVSCNRLIDSAFCNPTSELGVGVL